MDGPGYSEGKNGYENHFLFPSAQEGRQRDRLNTCPGLGFRVCAHVNTTAQPLKGPSSARCTDPQRQTRCPQWLVLKRSRTVPDCHHCQRRGGGWDIPQGVWPVEPIACCGHHPGVPHSRAGQNWLSLPKKMQDILEQRGPWAPLRGPEHYVALSSGTAHPLGLEKQ